MKIKALLAALIGAVGLSGASAGTWCPPAPADKCPIDCCADVGASMSVGYESDYIFYGQRLAADSVWADVNYTFEAFTLPVTVGVWYLSSFDDRYNYGDEADFYASVALPTMFGIDSTLGYTAYTYPTGGFVGAGTATQHELSLELSKEIWCGITASYRAAYDFTAWDIGNNNGVGGFGTGFGQQGAWMHTIGLSKSFDINDCVGLDLGVGVLYSDNYWAPIAPQGGGFVVPNSLSGAGHDNTGWNSYYLQAALPIALSNCATLTPYIGYNGTPDGWVLDGYGLPQAVWGDNANDLFHWGISLGVDF